MSRDNIIIRLIAIVTLFTSIANHNVCAQEMPPMTVKAKADSTTLIMGDRTVVNVSIVKNTHEGALVGMPQKGQDYYGLEMVDIAADSTDLGNRRTELNYRITFQAFDPSDLLTLPGFRYAAEGDTAISDILTFKVLPVELSPELGDPNNIDSLKIHPDETILPVSSRWYDYVPDWSLWALLGLAVIGLLIILFILYRKNGPNIFVPRKPVPPYELALAALKRLKEQKLIENGLSKQFYTEITDIWRKYLEGRFGINALEMTSSQILKQLRSNKETHLSAKEMEQILQLSDFVKFAAMNASREEMVKAYDTIYNFVESTKPEPEPEPEGKKS